MLQPELSTELSLEMQTLMNKMMMEVASTGLNGLLVVLDIDAQAFQECVVNLTFCKRMAPANDWHTSRDA